jgi:lysophospholipase L1-like esterase
MKKALLPLVLNLVCCFIQLLSYGQGSLYNIDFKHELNAFNGKGILGSLQDNTWNSTTAINSSGIPIVDSKGNPSSVKLSSMGIDGTWNESPAFGWGNFGDYWSIKDDGPANITLSDVEPGKKFELVLLCFGPADGRIMKASINGGNPKQTSGNGGALQWSPIPEPDANYIQFSGTVPSDGKLSIDLISVNDEADIQGLQLQVGDIVLPPLGERTYQLGADLKAGYNVKVMSIGTSLTDLPFGKSWPTELQNELWNKYQGHEIISNRAISSSDSNSGKENIMQWVAADNPDVVFIEYGINDAAGVPMEEVRSNLDFILSAILTNNPKADIIFQTMNNCIGENLISRPQEAYYQLYRDYAVFRGYTLIDNYPLWKSLYDTNPSLWSTYVPDGIHPTREGRLATVLDNMVNGVGSAKARVAAPSIALDGDKIVIYTTTGNAKIYYTTDGSIPTPNSIPYTSPFVFDSSKTIKAIALEPTLNASIVVTNTDLVLANSEPLLNKNLMIYPNPTKSSLYISGATSENTFFEILTIEGKMLQSGIVNGISISVDNLNTGIYIIKLKNSLGEHIQRFVKE